MTKSNEEIWKPIKDYEKEYDTYKITCNMESKGE